MRWMTWRVLFPCPYCVAQAVAAAQGVCVRHAGAVLGLYVPPLRAVVGLFKLVLVDNCVESAWFQRLKLRWCKLKPIETCVEIAWLRRLQLKHNELLSSVASIRSLRPTPWRKRKAHDVAMALDFLGISFGHGRARVPVSAA
jgi:hypothetical protein